jgi:hypothetical protein
VSDDDPWPVGSRVKIVRPEGRRTGRLGMVGEVTDRVYRPEVRRMRRDGTSEVLTPGYWLVFVVFARIKWADWDAARSVTGTVEERRQAGLRAADDWDAFFDRELERVV